MLRALLVLLAVAPSVGAATWAQERTSAAQPDAAGRRGNAQAEAVRRASLGLQLAAYGQQEQDPLALLVAARLLKQTPLRSEKLEKRVEGLESPPPRSDEPKPAPVTPEELLKRARELSGDAHAVQQLAVDIAAERGRGAADGPRAHADVAAAGATDVYEIEFRGGELARVALHGDGRTNLDLLVYTSDGKLVVSDTGESDACLVDWTPTETARFIIKVRNIGARQNTYTLLTN